MAGRDQEAGVEPSLEDALADPIVRSCSSATASTRPSEELSGHRSSSVGIEADRGPQAIAHGRLPLARRGSRLRSLLGRATSPPRARKRP